MATDQKEVEDTLPPLTHFAPSKSGVVRAATEAPKSLLSHN